MRHADAGYEVALQCAGRARPGPADGDALMLHLRPGALTLDDLLAVHRGGVAVEVDPAAWPGVQRSAAVVQAAAAGDAAVYGVNTGFGKLASTRIGTDDLATLQRNLIRSHSVGVGEPMAPAVVRLVMA
jgi:histidine ammonia-lyase